MGNRTDDNAPVVASAEALFRFQVVSTVLVRELAGEKRARTVGAVSAAPHLTLSGSLRTVPPRTLYRWLAAYRDRGFPGLEPRSRPTAEVSAVLDEALVAFLRAEKTQDPRASAPELIRRARELEVIDPDLVLDRVTVWRALRRMGLPTRRRPQKSEGDMRRFAYPNRMMMVLADGKHFRAGSLRLRRVALFFLDDATRKGLHVVVGTSESTELFLRGLHELIRKVGLMVVIYLDNGAGFISDDTVIVVSQLPGVHLVHGTPGYPEGHGKVERFNRTAVETVLRALDGAADVDPDCAALELRLAHFLGQYNQWPHESLDGACPAARWDSDPRPLRFPEDDRALDAAFVIREGRSVSKDHVIKYGGLEYEAPRGLGGSSVEVHRNVLSGVLSIVHDGRTVRLQPLDRAHNARDRRERPPEKGCEAPVSGEAVPRTAATIAYDRDHGPVVDRDGGFVPPRKKED